VAVRVGVGVTVGVGVGVGVTVAVGVGVIVGPVAVGPGAISRSAASDALLSVVTGWSRTCNKSPSFTASSMFVTEINECEESIERWRSDEQVGVVPNAPWHIVKLSTSAGGVRTPVDVLTRAA